MKRKESIVDKELSKADALKILSKATFGNLLVAPMNRLAEYQHFQGLE
jgi:hypothetical protein